MGDVSDHSVPSRSPAVDLLGRERHDLATSACERLERAGVEAVLLAFMDNAGVVRARAVPLRHFVTAATAGVGLSTAWHVVTATDRVTSSRYVGNPAGDFRLVADPLASRPLAGKPRWALGPVDQYDQDGQPHTCCPRDFLRRAVDRCARLGVRVLVGYELEFFVARQDPRGAVHPAHDGPAVGALALIALADFAEQLISALADDESGLETLNGEYSNGQLEVSLSPKAPLAAVDANLASRLGIHAIAARHDLRASFSPAFSGPMGNGGHLHVSVWRDGHNCCSGGNGPAGMRPEAEGFLAGILRDLPAMTAIGAPTAASYLRLQPSRWAGAYRCWGVQNREAALRFVAGGARREAAANVEIKCFDEAANPYLLLGALLEAGAAGIEEGLRVPPPYHGDPALGEQAALAASEVVRLPASLEDAIAEMRGSSRLAASMGAALFDSYLAVRREEAAAFAGASEEEIVDAYRWRF